MGETNLDYLYEVNDEMVAGWFFIDYYEIRGDYSPRWVRSPMNNASTIVDVCSTLDWSSVCDFRIQRYEDLITPVDDQGRSATHCEFVGTEFSPCCQLGEFLFDRRYRITPQNCRIQS